MVIGVLAVQGAFIEHERVLDALGVSNFEIRQKKDLKQHMDGLILPGGESTVMGKLLKDLELFEPLKALIEGGLPVFGTCAGMILLAEQLSNDESRYFATLPVTVRRNAYGRQLGSFHARAQMNGIGEIPMTFIRAPYVERTCWLLSIIILWQSDIKTSWRPLFIRNWTRIYLYINIF